MRNGFASATSYKMNDKYSGAADNDFKTCQKEAYYWLLTYIYNIYMYIYIYMHFIPPFPLHLANSRSISSSIFFLILSIFYCFFHSIEHAMFKNVEGLGYKMTSVAPLGPISLFYFCFCMCPTWTSTNFSVGNVVSNNCYVGDPEAKHSIYIKCPLYGWATGDVLKGNKN